MSMTKIPKFPRKMEELLGPEGKDQFIDFLNESFHNQEDNVLQVVSDRFDRRVTEEISGMRMEMYNGINKLENRITDEISGLRIEMHNGINKLENRITGEISGLRTEVYEEVSSIKVQIADLRSEMKSDIATQTKWLLTVILAAAALISVLQPVMLKILKIG